MHLNFLKALIRIRVLSMIDRVCLESLTIFFEISVPSVSSSTCVLNIIEIDDIQLGSFTISIIYIGPHRPAFVFVPSDPLIKQTYQQGLSYLV